MPWASIMGSPIFQGFDWVVATGGKVDGFCCDVVLVGWGGRAYHKSKLVKGVMGKVSKPVTVNLPRCWFRLVRQRLAMVCWVAIWLPLNCVKLLVALNPKVVTFTTPLSCGLPEEALIGLSGGWKIPWVVIWIWPPRPWLALAVMGLFSRAVIVLAVMLRLPPFPLFRLFRT